MRHRIPVYLVCFPNSFPPLLGQLLPLLSCVLVFWVFLLIFLKKINNSKTLAALLLEIGRGGWEIPGQLGLLEPKFGSELE